MVIEVALGGGRRVCLRLKQKERSVTVINVLAETETVNSQSPVVTIRVLKSTPRPAPRLKSTRMAGGLITVM